MGLKEYFILKPQFETRPSESFLSSFQQTKSHMYNDNRGETGNLKMVSLDDVTSYMFNTFEKYGNAWKTEKLDNAKDYANKLREVKELVNERARLDSYFVVPGFKIEVIRVYMLKLIIRMQNEGFVKQVNSLSSEVNFDYPSIEDIFLRMFVACVREFDEYYIANPASARSILIGSTWEIPKKNDMEFFICKNSGGKLTGITGSQKFEKSFDLEGIFSVIVFFIHHIKKMHNAYISAKRLNTFGELIKSFDITDERYLDN